MREEKDYQLASYLSGMSIETLKADETKNQKCQASKSAVECILRRCPAIYECMGIILKD